MSKHKISKFLFFLTSGLIILTLNIFIFQSKLFPYISSVTNQSLSKLDYIISKPFKIGSKITQSTDDLLNTYKENKELKKSILKRKEQEHSIKYYKVQNKKLKSIISQDIRSPFQLTSEVTVRSSHSWNNAIIINSGKKDGVSSQMLVTSDSYLIGQISGKVKDSSHVDLLTSGKVFDLPIKIVDKSTIIYGNLKYYDKNKQLMIASEFNSNDSISNEAKVYTSGLDGKTVADVPIGKVISVKNRDDKLNRQVSIKLLSDFNDINYVSVLGVKND